MGQEIKVSTYVKRTNLLAGLKFIYVPLIKPFTDEIEEILVKHPDPGTLNSSDRLISFLRLSEWTKLD